MSSQCTNAALGEAHGLSHSTVSRMRKGTRTGSPQTQLLLAELAELPLETIARAAIAARTGDTDKWNEILDKACGTAESE